MLLGGTPGDDETVEPFIEAGFDQEGGFDEDYFAIAVALPGGKLLLRSFAHAGMNDSVEMGEFDGIGEDDVAEFSAVDAAAGSDLLTEFLEDFPKCRLARLDELMAEGVGVEDGEAKFAEDGGDTAFAAGDSTG